MDRYVFNICEAVQMIMWIARSGGLLWTRQWTFVLHKMRRISWLAEELSACNWPCVWWACRCWCDCLFVSLSSCFCWMEFVNALNASSLTPCSRIVFDKITAPQPVKKSPTFYVTKWFISVFTAVLHLSVSRAGSVDTRFIISLEDPF